MKDSRPTTKVDAPRARANRWRRWLMPAATALDYHDRLYRYRTFQHEKDVDGSKKGYLLDTIANGRLYARLARTLNHPWEVSPRMVFWPFGDPYVQFAKFIGRLS